jgi:hypothetical protein
LQLQFAGAPANAIDAQQTVKRRAGERNQPDHPDPTDGGANVALAEDGMGGGDPGNSECQCRDDHGPVSGD